MTQYLIPLPKNVEGQKRLTIESVAPIWAEPGGTNNAT